MSLRLENTSSDFNILLKVDTQFSLFKRFKLTASRINHLNWKLFSNCWKGLSVFSREEKSVSHVDVINIDLGPHPNELMILSFPLSNIDRSLVVGYSKFSWNKIFYLRNTSTPEIIRLENCCGRTDAIWKEAWNNLYSWFLFFFLKVIIGFKCILIKNRWYIHYLTEIMKIFIGFLLVCWLFSGCRVIG